MFCVLQSISGKSSSHRSGVRSLSESDEKKMDDAIRLAHEYARQASSGQEAPMTPGAGGGGAKSTADSLSDHSHNGGADSDSCNASSSSTKLRNVFKKKRKSPPKHDRKTYTEEIAQKADASEEIGLEAQEVYNQLIGRVSTSSSAAATSRGEMARHHSREERTHRTVEQRQTSPGPASPPERAPIRYSRNQNANVRAPIIPGRTSMMTSSNVTAEVDSNPLRQLRASSAAAFIPNRTSTATSRATSDASSRSKLAPKTAPKPPKLSANTPFFDKLKEQEQERDSSLGSTDGSEEGTSINSIPLPPRIAPRTSSSSAHARAQPRQRKYPLDLSHYNGNGLHNSPPLGNNNNIHTRTVSGYDVTRPPLRSRELPPDPESGHEEEELNSTRDSEDSVFSSESSHHSSSLEVKGHHHHHQHRHHASPTSLPTRPPTLTTSSDCYRVKHGDDIAPAASQFSVKSVKLSAKDLGYLDTTDLFWSKRVSLHELGTINEQSESESVVLNGEHAQPSPIPGRYKTSDTVSYEDLLDFALDGVLERYFMLPSVLLSFLQVLICYCLRAAENWFCLLGVFSA